MGKEKGFGELFIVSNKHMGSMLQIGVYGEDGKYQVLTIGFSVLTNTFNLNVQTTNELSLCEDTKVVDIDKDCEKIVVFTQKRQEIRT